ncbi:hypothetical protein JHK86_052831 [Glycine max]|nr:hypothetical protein JHK86_052831 [Glycine max]
MKDRFRRRLCFRCDEPFSLGHVCHNKHLHMLMLGEGEKVEDKEQENGEEEKLLAGSNMQLNVGSIAGMTIKKSLKLWGTISGKGWWYWWIQAHHTTSYPSR